MAALTDEHGRAVWLVSWGQMHRTDWRAVLVKAYDADEALAVAREKFPERLPPDRAVLAAEPTARAALDGTRTAAASRLDLIN